MVTFGGGVGIALVHVVLGAGLVITDDVFFFFLFLFALWWRW